MIPSKAERVAEVIHRLEKLSPCSSFEAMRKQLADTLNEVEDELTPFPYNPADIDPNRPLTPTDRMYPVQDDNINDVTGHPAVKQLTSAGHQIFVGQNGAVEVRSKRYPDGTLAVPPTTGPVVFARPGTDGRGVWELS